MEKTLLTAQIPKHQIRIRNGNHKTKALAKAFTWLHDLKLCFEYQYFVEIRSLLPEETWKHYELFEIEGLREQSLLEAASKKLRVQWRKKRPAMFNQDKKRKKPNESN